MNGPWANFPAPPCGVSIGTFPVSPGEVQAPWGDVYPCTDAAKLTAIAPNGPWADAELWFNEESNHVSPYPGPFGDSVAAIESGVDWERAARGIPPVSWSNADPAIDAAVQLGADTGADPVLPQYVITQHRAWSSDWASGTSTAKALTGWIYDDGPQGWNLDCPAAGDPGCGGHTRSILGQDMVNAGLSDVESGAAAVGSDGITVALWPTATVTPPAPPAPAPVVTTPPTTPLTTPPTVPPTTSPTVPHLGWTIYWFFALPHWQLVEAL